MFNERQNNVLFLCTIQNIQMMNIMLILFGTKISVFDRKFVSRELRISTFNKPYLSFSGKIPLLKHLEKRSKKIYSSPSRKSPQDLEFYRLCYSDLDGDDSHYQES